MTRVEEEFTPSPKAEVRARIAAPGLGHKTWSAGDPHGAFVPAVHTAAPSPACPHLRNKQRDRCPHPGAGGGEHRWAIVPFITTSLRTPLSLSRSGSPARQVRSDKSSCSCINQDRQTASGSAFTLGGGVTRTPAGYVGEALPSSLADTSLASSESPGSRLSVAGVGGSQGC